MRVEKLGAHLEAYVDTLPVITALRLCNKFGKGPECHIRKLPTEIVDAVEELVINLEREKRLIRWSQLLRCYTGQCNPENGHPLSGEENVCYADHDCVLEDCAHQFHEFHNATHREVCLNNSREFERELRSGSLWSRRKLLRSQLGIALWISPTCSNANGYTALAYLTLPDDPQRNETWLEAPCWEINDIGYGMPMHVGASPSPASLKRFPRALMKLGLEVFVHCRQKALSTGNREVKELEVTDDSAESGEVVEKAATWPQLTLLVYIRPGRDDDH